MSPSTRDRSSPATRDGYRASPEKAADRLVNIVGTDLPTSVESGERVNGEVRLRNTALLILPGDVDRCTDGQNIGYNIEVLVRAGGQVVDRTTVCALAQKSTPARVVFDTFGSGQLTGEIVARGAQSGEVVGRETFSISVTAPPDGGDDGGGGGGGDDQNDDDDDQNNDDQNNDDQNNDDEGGLSEWWAQQSDGTKIAVVGGSGLALYALTRPSSPARTTRR